LKVYSPEPSDAGKLTKMRSAMVILETPQRVQVQYFLNQFLWLGFQHKVHRIYPVEEDDIIIKIF
jgi:hypothetical protein